MDRKIHPLAPLLKLPGGGFLFPSRSPTQFTRCLASLSGIGLILLLIPSHLYHAWHLSTFYSLLPAFHNIQSLPKPIVKLQRGTDRGILTFQLTSRKQRRHMRRPMKPQLSVDQQENYLLLTDLVGDPHRLNTLFRTIAAFAAAHH